MDSFSLLNFTRSKAEKNREIRGSRRLANRKRFLGRRRGSKFSSGKGSSISRPGNTKEGKEGEEEGGRILTIDPRLEV